MKDFMQNAFRIGASKLGFSLLLNPIVLLVLVLIIVVFLTFYLIIAESSNDDKGIEEEKLENIYTLCEPKDIEDNEQFQKDYYEQFEGKGAFDGAGKFFLETANKYDIDPVLLASISFHETGYGTSNLVKEKNNPGGLYNSAENKFFDFPSLQQGIDRMAINLYDNYIADGLVTIRQIGNKYAPIGVENDPNNLNAHWIPTITDITKDFGGLVMNCKELNFGNGELAYPIENAVVTSSFGYRIHPITGVPKLHKGIDFDCEGGDPLYSALEGNVVRSTTGCTVGNEGCGGGYGNHVVIEHDGKYTLYAHMTDVMISNGDQLTTSQQIGTCGTTGSSTGTHLHFEVQLSMYGEHQDPAPYFESEEEVNE